MISSMTGYGRSEWESGGKRFAVEIRSVNNRYLDVQLKMPRSLTVLETRMRKAIQERFSRGRFEAFVNRNGEEGQPVRFVLDSGLAGQYISILHELKDRFDLPGEINISLVGGMQDIVGREGVKEDPETIWPALSSAFGRAMDELYAMRAAEGEALTRDMSVRLERIERFAAEVRTLTPRTVESARTRMAEAVKRLTGEQLDPSRLAQEIALLAERTDVTEELTRLSSHLSQFRGLLAGTRGESVGRKLDFLLQEMAREANTISSKAADADIAHHVVEIKAELEKIREQAQNIE